MIIEDRCKPGYLFGTDPSAFRALQEIKYLLFFNKIPIIFRVLNTHVIAFSIGDENVSTITKSYCLKYSLGSGIYIDLPTLTPDRNIIL